MLVTVDLKSDRADLHMAASALGVPVSALDSEYGLVMVDPTRHRFAAKVQWVEFAKRRQTTFTVEGPFADPSLDPFLANSELRSHPTLET